MSKPESMVPSAKVILPENIRVIQPLLERLAESISDSLHETVDLRLKGVGASLCSYVSEAQWIIVL